MHEDDLDRALLALPLEPLPDGLRASILAAVALAERPFLTAWEMFGIGAILALGSWLAVLVLGNRGTVGPWVVDALETLGRFVAEPMTLVWIAVGIASTICLSLLSIPRRAVAGR